MQMLLQRFQKAELPAVEANQPDSNICLTFSLNKRKKESHEDKQRKKKEEVKSDIRTMQHL